jgi:signal transduction histidine kinase
LAGSRGAAHAVGLIAVATVALRRRWPVVACGCALAALTAYQAIAGSSLAVAPLVIVLDYYSLGRRAEGRGRRAVDLVLILVPLPIIWLGPNGSGAVNIVTPWLFFGVVPFGAGRLLGEHESLTAELRVRIEQLDRAQRERERLLASVERGRIAQDLHDVVGHSVSVMVIQAVAARRVAGSDRAATAEALRQVALTGRKSLSEIRRLVGPSHHADDDGSATPGLRSLDALVRQTSAAGLPVSVEFKGVRPRLPAGIDLAAYRIVQEALTNAIKHAGAATARVHVEFDPAAVVVSIRDDGSGSSGGERDGGPARYGLLGMRERVGLYGGDLRAGARQDGGFEVVARIPVGGAA